MRAAWWWIDRWRKSTAYTDMTLEQQGAYRNLLDELWLRDGLLPTDERVLAKICGDALAWPAVREAVLARFHASDGGLRNTTHDTIAAESQRRANKQKAYRDRNRPGISRGNESGNAFGNIVTGVTPSPSPDPSPYPSKDQTDLTSTDLPASPGSLLGFEPKPEPEADRVCRLYVMALDYCFGRKTRVHPDDLKSAIRKRLKTCPWVQIVATPILVKAQGTWTLPKPPSPIYFLRDGEHAKNHNGNTYGARNWIARAVESVDGTKIGPREAAAAKAVGVLEWLADRGAEITELSLDA